jgi:tetratricopeptide (TPR) repeat protein
MPATMPAASQPIVPPTADEAPPTDPQAIEADAALAERFAGIAELEFNTKFTDQQAWPWIWRHQAALMSACTTLAPRESRFPRLMADAYAQLHDEQGESDALRKAIDADPSDEFSWNRRLDLFLQPMQTATQKIDYLRQIIALSTGDVIVPPDVRAHAGFRCAQLLLERGEDDSAASVLAEALRTCPSSVECLQLRYRMLPPDAPRFERCEQLLDLLRANPLQVRYSVPLADMIADSGLVSESLPWYQLAVASAHLQGDPATHSMLNWAAELYISDEKIDALKLNTALLQVDPTYTPAYFLQLVITRSTGDKDAFTKALHEATSALSNRVTNACNDLLPPGATKATTRPISDPSPLKLPDLDTAVAQINKGAKPQLKEQFTEAVADLALLEGYFAEQSDLATPLVDALAKVVPANSPELARLRGWNDLLAKKPDDARAKFLSVAARDPLAELGLVKIMLDTPADHIAAESTGRRLLQDHPSGLLGALLWEQLHGSRVKMISTTQGDALREALQQFPASILNLAEQPQNFYAIHVEPDPLGSAVGEPLLAKVSIRNISEYDLTIGPDGVLKPEMLFTMTPKVGTSPHFSAFDTIAGPTVLPSHRQSEQIVRVDQTQLLAFLNTQSNLQFEISGTLTTNETAHRLGGYPVQFFKSFYRMSSPLNGATEQSAMTDLTEGRPDQKIEALTIIRQMVTQLSQQKNPDAQTRQVVVSFIDAMNRSAKTEALPAVSAWAALCEFGVLNEADRSDLVRDLAEDPDWRHRQVALLLLHAVSPDIRRQILDLLVIDPQSSVRADAIAAKGLMSLPPAATQPATMPTTMPMP